MNKLDTYDRFFSEVCNEFHQNWFDDFLELSIDHFNHEHKQPTIKNLISFVKVHNHIYALMIAVEVKCKGITYDDALSNMYQSICQNF